MLSFTVSKSCLFQTPIGPLKLCASRDLKKLAVLYWALQMYHSHLEKNSVQMLEFGNLENSLTWESETISLIIVQQNDNTQLSQTALLPEIDRKLLYNHSSHRIC